MKNSAARDPRPSHEKECKCDERPDRKFEKPVSWLLGRQLIASLKSTLLYTAYGTKIDARDWMDAKVFPTALKTPAQAWSEMYDRNDDMHIPKPVDFTSDDGEFWFDYISDTGDGMTATYSVAYLCLSDVWIDDLWKTRPKGEILPGQEQDKVLVRMRTKETDNVNGMKQLPRGEFLLVGGDTSYHMADYASLHLRFQQPFQWAYEDLRKDLKLKPLAEMTDAERQQVIKRFRPIFGIPGNHDYYDMLDGFRRQFREPTISRRETKFFSNPYDSSQLQIPGFRRYQETSYIALRLPFDWMIWGLDTEVGKIDERQRDFFKGIKGEGNPKRLIVCTSAPTTVFGKFADKDDEKSAKAFFQLGLPRPFLRSENEDVPAGKAAEEEPPPEETKLGADDIRLDLAGDVHHYARYWGPASPNTSTRSGSSKKKPLERTNYASVMSGLGGAFHHPSTTYVDEIREQALYPDEKSSRQHVAGEIFNPWRVVKGGGVWFVGGLVALILSFAAIADDSTRPAIHNFLLFRSLGITQAEQYQPTVESPSEAKKRQADIPDNILTNIRRKLGFAMAQWSPKAPTDPDCQAQQRGDVPLFLWGKCRTEWPGDYLWGFWLAIITVPVMFTAFLITRHHYSAWRVREEVNLRARTPEERFNNDTHVRKVNWNIWGFTVGTTLLAFIALLLVMPYRHFITPFGNSLLVLLTICWAAFAIYLSLKYSDWLFEQASQRKIGRRDWAITWVLAACAFFAVGIGLWVFGKANPAAYLVADIVSVLVVLAIPVLLLMAALKLGGAHQKGLGKVGMAVIGIWHSILQIGAAVFLLKKGTWLTVVISVGLVLVFWWIGRTLMRHNQRALLTVAWVIFGAAMLTLPPLVYHLLIQNPDSFPSWLYAEFFWPHPVDPVLPFYQYEWWIDWKGWWQLIPIFLGGVFGAFLSCVWLGWYFGVCLGFNGHNNESGGAARIEKFKQMVRFRLTKNSLTGYVIAVRDPQRCGKCLHPEIVDIFHLTNQQSSSVKPSGG